MADVNNPAHGALRYINVHRGQPEVITVEPGSPLYADALLLATSIYDNERGWIPYGTRQKDPHPTIAPAEQASAEEWPQGQADAHLPPRSYGRSAQTPPTLRDVAPRTAVYRSGVVQSYVEENEAKRAAATLHDKLGAIWDVYHHAFHLLDDGISPDEMGSERIDKEGIAIEWELHNKLDAALDAFEDLFPSARHGDFSREEAIKNMADYLENPK